MSLLNTIKLCLVFVFAFPLFAQVPVGKAQEKAILLVGGTAHLGNGQVIEKANIGFDKGKLTFVTADQVNAAGYEVVDISGKHVYPGLILPVTDLGLGEVSSVRATLDATETGYINPNVGSKVAYNTDSELIPTLRFNGVLTAQVTPRGGLVSGTSSLFSLNGWNWEDAVLVEDNGLHVNWPDRKSRSFDWTTRTVKYEKNKYFDEMMTALTKLFVDAKAYHKSKDRKHNLKLEAVLGLFDGSKTLYIHSNEAGTMVESVTFAKEHGVKRMAIAGAVQALDIAEFLVKHEVPVILGSLHRLPSNSFTDIDLPFRMPALLDEAGVQFCLGYGSRANARNLAFTAGTAAAYGLDKERALRAVTLDTAKILGVGDRLGSLEVGKAATLFVSEGDALDMRGNILTHIFIDGSNVPLDGMQQRLYQRYKEKYGH